MTTKPTKLFDLKDLSPDEIQNHWEQAYARFETPAEEIVKFIRRLEYLGQSEWPRDAQIVDIFSGKCLGIRALEQLGFTNLEGVDISENLLSFYKGDAELYVADCRELPFEKNSRDVIVVQGGLHHLPELPADLTKTLSEIKRVLRPTGRFVMVEPWQTPFLRLIHYLSARNTVRRFSNKFDAFETMTHYERDTYYNWLNRPAEILDLLDKNFTNAFIAKKWGKVYFVGIPK